MLYFHPLSLGKIPMLDTYVFVQKNGYNHQLENVKVWKNCVCVCGKFFKGGMIISPNDS